MPRVNVCRDLRAKKSLGNVGRQLGDDGRAGNETCSLDVTATYPSQAF